MNLIFGIHIKKTVIPIIDHCVRFCAEIHHHLKRIVNIDDIDMNLQWNRHICSAHAQSLRPQQNLHISTLCSHRKAGAGICTTFYDRIAAALLTIFRVRVCVPIYFISKLNCNQTKWRAVIASECEKCSILCENCNDSVWEWHQDILHAFPNFHRYLVQFTLRFVRTSVSIFVSLRNNSSESINTTITITNTDSKCVRCVKVTKTNSIDKK